ncbi:MAG: hypothetical protein M3O15_04145 [Acidobacteriota bacterium]|nr:hypothetical protein [Acidobacteriota bacterium]
MDYAEVLLALSQSGARFAVAGGFACLAHGVVRVTLDLDLVVEMSDDNLILLWETLGGLGFVTQQPVRRRDAVSVEKLSRLARDKGMQALSWVHGAQPFLIVDLLVGEGFRWSRELCQEVRLFGISAPVLSREELLRLKRAAGREKDLVDVRELERLT